MNWSAAKATRHANIWLPGYLRERVQRYGASSPGFVWVCIADHFEPYWHRADDRTAQRRVEQWMRHWPAIASRHTDSRGQAPCYTFFYPEEEYHPDLLAMLSEMAETRIADVEVHLHHDGEDERVFVDRIGGFTETLHNRHGLLRKQEGKIAFGFIHGNWALDNSRPDGRWCGLNNEISLLRDLNCYADFTMPSVPSPTQTRIVNTIYWATDDPARPKSHDIGVPVTVGGPEVGDLMMIPGPLGFNWRDRRRWWAPQIEIGELSASNPPTRHRAKLWLRYAPQIGEHRFIKLFTHGAQEENAEMLLGGGLDALLQDLHAECAVQQLRLCVVSAWQMWQAIEVVRQQGGPRDGAPETIRTDMHEILPRR